MIDGEGGIAAAVEITPVEAVVAAATPLFLVEQRTGVATRLAAIGTVATGITMRPIAAANRIRRVGYRQKFQGYTGLTPRQYHAAGNATSEPESEFPLSQRL